MKLALVALEDVDGANQLGWWARSKAITAIKQALAAPTVQEPVKLRPEDVHVETYSVRSGGLVLKLDNGVRLIHKPTGVVVRCNSERSQHRNREVAWSELERLLTTPPAAQPATVRDTVAFKQFLSDVHTAAGLVTHGKQCKALGERLGEVVMRYTATSPAAPVQEEDLYDLAVKADNEGKP